MNNMEQEDEINATKEYILSLCSAIGGLEEVIMPDNSVGQIYCVGDEALACLKDLKRAIRTDIKNNERTVLKALEEFNIIETDLVPLLLSFRKDRNEVALRFILACVELLVPMTWPIDSDVTEEEEIEQDPNLMACYRNYKLHLLTEGVFETILTLIMNSVRIPYRDRSIIDQTTIRLGLYLFRNLTAIPDLNMSQSSNMDSIRMSHMQETLLLRYHEADVTEFLLTIASNSAQHEGTAEWNVLVLESLYNFVKYVDAKDIFSHGIKNGPGGGDMKDISSKLSNLLTIENSMKRRKTVPTPSRHSRFGGTYVIEWDQKSRVSHSQVAGFADSTLLIEAQKKTVRTGRKRKLEDKSIMRRVYKNSQALTNLKYISRSFIKSCFNAFFTRIMKDMIREDTSIQRNDYIRYHYTMKWFLEYHGYEQNAAMRNMEYEMIEDSTDFDFSLVASALDLKTVLFCLRHMRISLDNKRWFDLQMAIDCLRQMLTTIGVMAQSETEEYRAIAEHIQSNLYYEQQHLDLLLEIIRCYSNQSNGYLKSVVLLTHVLLKLLDKYQQGKKMLFTRKKTKSNKPKKTVIENQEESLIADDSENEEEERDRQAVYKDQVFKFDSFEQRYISTELVRAYCLLLENYMDLEPKYIACITNMFHRLMVKRRAEYLFWKLPILDLFNRILCNSHVMIQTKELSMLLEFIKYCTYQFFKAAKVYPLIFVEALIPKLKSNRTMWEQPDEEKLQEEQDYLDDVNYIPPTTNTTTATTDNVQEEEEENHNIIDDAMADYLFGAFDRRNDEEKEEQTPVIKENNNMDSLDLEVETNIAEVDELLSAMGVETN